MQEQLALRSRKRTSRFGWQILPLARTSPLLLLDSFYLLARSHPNGGPTKRRARGRALSGNFSITKHKDSCKVYIMDPRRRKWQTVALPTILFFFPFRKFIKSETKCPSKNTSQSGFLRASSPLQSNRQDQCVGWAFPRRYQSPEAANV